MKLDNQIQETGAYIASSNCFWQFPTFESISNQNQQSISIQQAFGDQHLARFQHSQILNKKKKNHTTAYVLLSLL